jgi:hypothetical protein
MPLVAAIPDGRARHLDLLRVTVQTNDAVWSRYAHSYIGFGLTPLMAIGLKKDKKGTVMDLMSVMRTFNSLEPVEIVRAGGEQELYDSPVFANVARIAKYGRMSNSGRPDDGLLEVVSCPHRGRWRIALTVLRAATVELGSPPRRGSRIGRRGRQHQHPVGNRRDGVLGDLGVIDLPEMRRDVAGGQTAGMQRQHDLIDAGQPPLPLGHDHRLEAAVAIPRHLDGDLTRVGEHRLGAFPVAGVAPVPTDRIVLDAPMDVKLLGRAVLGR